jgi:phospholipid/cholesterol/gamma-HCH transport system substrate-binding protein
MTSAAARTRLVAAGALLLAALVAWLVLRGDGKHTYALIFQNAGQLVTGDQVQVGGVAVGSIDSIDLTSDNLARVQISVQAPYAPLHAGTTAEIRATSLSGVANRYIALRLGANNHPTLRDGATLGVTQTSGIVDVDQLFDTFDPRTRRALQQVVQGSATEFAGVARQLQRSATYFSPALSTTDQLVAKLLQDQPTFQGFLTSAGRTLQALAQRAPQLTELVDRGARAFAATAAEHRQLRAGLAQLPSTLRAGQAALDGLLAAMPDLRRLVSASSAATPGLRPFLGRLRGLLSAAAPALTDLGVALDRPRSSADIVGVAQALPGWDRQLQPTTAHATQALTQLEPILQFIRPYAPDLAASLRAFGQSSANYDANGHYARVAATFGTYAYTGAAPGVLVPNVGSPFAGVQTGVLSRCPGAATQAPADGSAPFRDTPALPCDASEVPPQ